METKKAYDAWSQQYDINENKTRDLEAAALQSILGKIEFDSCLEIGCGTGKNTTWLIQKAKEVLAVDFSDEMLKKAKSKIDSHNVNFLKADILKDWNFTNKKYQLVSFSLILEHIENLERIFSNVTKVSGEEGYVYIGELHPFKQYTGTKVKFQNGDGLQTLNCYNHNVSDFVQAAKKYGFVLEDLNEFFDGDDRDTIPRILTLLFRNLQST